MSDATSVYQYFNRAGRLLYVGVTNRGTKRMSEHASSKVWWGQAATCTVEHFDTRDEALARETYLIVTRQPPFNTACKKKISVTFVASPWRVDGVPLVLRCGRCNENNAGPSGLCGRCENDRTGSRRSTSTPVQRRPVGDSHCVSCSAAGALSARDLCRSCEGLRGRALQKTKESN